MRRSEEKKEKKTTKRTDITGEICNYVDWNHRIVVVDVVEPSQTPSKSRVEQKSMERRKCMLKQNKKKAKKRVSMCAHRLKVFFLLFSREFFSLLVSRSTSSWMRGLLLTRFMCRSFCAYTCLGRRLRNHQH